MCDCRFDETDFRDLKRSVDELENMVSAVYDSFKYELVSKLVKPVSALRLAASDARILQANNIDTIFDLVVKCSYYYSPGRNSRYCRVSLDDTRKARIEAKLNTMGLSFRTRLNSDIKSAVYVRLGRDERTGE